MNNELKDNFALILPHCFVLLYFLARTPEKKNGKER